MKFKICQAFADSIFFIQYDNTSTVGMTVGGGHNLGQNQPKIMFRIYSWSLSNGWVCINKLKFTNRMTRSASAVSKFLQNLKNKFYLFLFIY